MKLAQHASNPKLPSFVRHAITAANIAKARDNSSHDVNKDQDQIHLKKKLDYGDFASGSDTTTMVRGGTVSTEGGEIKDAFVKTQMFDPWRKTPSRMGHDATITYKIERGEDTTTFEARRRDRTGTVNYNEKVVVDDSGQILDHKYKDWSLSYPMAFLSHLGAPVSTSFMVGVAGYAGSAIAGPVGGALAIGTLLATSTHFRHKHF